MWCNLFLIKTTREHQVVTIRNWNAINIDALSDYITKSDLCLLLSKHDISDKVQQDTSTLSSLLNKHAPPKQRTVKVRPNTSWYNDDIYAEKQKKRKLKKNWEEISFGDVITRCTQCKNRK